MGKETGHSFKYIRPKISSPAPKKPVLLFSANLTSYTTNLTPTFMPHQVQHKESTYIHNKVNISNTDDIHSCVTPRKEKKCSGHNYTPRLTPLITTLPLLPAELPKKNTYPQLVKNICVSKSTTNILMLISVSTQGY